MASYLYILEPRAQLEYEWAVEWYFKRSKKAAINFINNTDIALYLICNQPYQLKNNYKNFYEVLIRKYPFSIIYTIEEGLKTLVIFSIFHHKRNPKIKYDEFI